MLNCSVVPRDNPGSGMEAPAGALAEWHHARRPVKRERERESWGLEASSDLHECLAEPVVPLAGTVPHFFR